MTNLDRFRPWFWAATAYNAVWGAIAGLFPNAMFAWLGLPPPHEPWLFQCIGMIVGVYALGYALVALDPVRYGVFAWLGIIGKALGPIGFLLGALQGQIPWRFGWINVTNDLIWLPAFCLFAYRHYKAGYLLKV
ncbi:MAG: alkyl hydroperoxide reductase [Armatimonadetes bacterium]|nr:alkyl hydroperoxide reductase [Armatimonadota bacterium]